MTAATRSSGSTTRSDDDRPCTPPAPNAFLHDARLERKAGLLGVASSGISAVRSAARPGEPRNVRKVRQVRAPRASGDRPGSGASRRAAAATFAACASTLLVLAALLATAVPAAAHPNPNGLPLRFGGTGEKVDGERRAGGAARARAAPELRSRLPAGDRHPGPRARRQPRGLHLQHEPRRPSRRLGRLQGAAVHRQGRPRVRVLRHDAAVPDQRADAVRAPDRRRGARHERSREPEADDEPAHARDADAARVACCSTRSAGCSPR